jgi:hypothetical protein
MAASARRTKINGFAPPMLALSIACPTEPLLTILDPTLGSVEDHPDRGVAGSGFNPMEDCIGAPSICMQADRATKSGLCHRR